jgi:hypothetical protein
LIGEIKTSCLFLNFGRHLGDLEGAGLGHFRQRLSQRQSRSRPAFCLSIRLYQNLDDQLLRAWENDPMAAFCPACEFYFLLAPSPVSQPYTFSMIAHLAVRRALTVK